MLYDASDKDALRAWLVKTLEPICDAEPVALATYILALLEHDAPEQELRQEFIKQLEEFLENREVTGSFVDTLFAALRSKSYVPYSTSATLHTPSNSNSRDAGIPIPLEGLLGSSSSDRGVKRSLDEDDSDYRRGPPKGPRLGDDNRFARFPGSVYGGQEGGIWQHGGQNGFEMTMDGVGMMNGFNARGTHPRFPTSPSGWVDLPRGVCRDYHIKGYCARGHLCKFSHDDAAFAPAQMMFPPAMGGSMGANGANMPMMPMFAGAIPFGMDAQNGAAYDPHEAQLDMRSPTIPGNSIPQIGSGVQSQNMIGEPSARDGRRDNPTIQDLAPKSINGEPSAPSAPSAIATSTSLAESTSSPQSGRTSNFTATPVRPQRGGNFHYRGSRGGRGTFAGDHQSFRSDHQTRDGKTLVVEKIPEEHLTLEAVNNWFKRFGTVTNVAVDTHAAKALVSFSTHEEAHAAWKTQEAVFNNRFVKIFWHRPLEGQGTVGARMLQASAPIMANIANKEAPSVSTGNSSPHGVASSATKPPATVAATVAAAAAASSSKSALAAKQEMLEKKIAEQKELMARLIIASPEEKKEIMTRLRKLDELASSPGNSAKAASVAQPASSNHQAVKVPSTAVDKERRTKELLDMELELHAAKTSTEDVADSKDGEGEETTETLQEKLAKLRAEAEALGISADAPGETSTHVSGYHGYRGRGRGRGRPFFRGGMRGGPPRASMKLDNRPKSLLVKGVDTQNTDIIQSIRSWYETGGQVANVIVSEDDGIVVQFHSRSAAEAALAKGASIPSAGTLKVTWHQEAVSTIKQPIPFPSDAQKVTSDRPLSPPRHDDVVEDVVEDPGWGNDEDGMGTF